MKDVIIRAAIEGLQTEGLKFSIDTIASELKISKKTIYRFFPDKETLAYALYETYYSDAVETMKNMQGTSNNRINILLVYYEAGRLVRKEIFNKYKLNAKVFSYACQKQDYLWSVLCSILLPSKNSEECDVLRAIVEGAFEKADERSIAPKTTAERLMKLL